MVRLFFFCFFAFFLAKAPPIFAQGEKKKSVDCVSVYNVINVSAYDGSFA